MSEMNEPKNSDAIETLKNVKLEDIIEEEEIKPLIFWKYADYNQERWRHTPGRDKIMPSIYFKHYAKYMNIHKTAERFCKSLNGVYVPTILSKRRHLILTDRNTGVLILDDKFAIFTYCMKELKGNDRHEFLNAVAVLRSTWPWNSYSVLCTKKLKVHDLRDHPATVKYSDEARRLVETLGKSLTNDDDESAENIKRILEEYKSE